MVGDNKKKLKNANFAEHKGCGQAYNKSNRYPELQIRRIVS
jgi:hypothetical protein